jgi:hypothetical protein
MSLPMRLVDFSLNNFYLEIDFLLFFISIFMKLREVEQKHFEKRGYMVKK